MTQPRPSGDWCERMPCSWCGSKPAKSVFRGYCSEVCRAAASIETQRRERQNELSGGEVDRILDAAVRRETMMPWERTQ